MDTFVRKRSPVTVYAFDAGMVDWESSDNVVLLEAFLAMNRSSEATVQVC